VASEARIPAPPHISMQTDEICDTTGYWIPINYVTHVKVDPSVKDIHDHAFQHCDSLVAVEFSEGLERIARYAFSGCEVLKLIHKLPPTTSTLKDSQGDWCFRI
jgi:hypothetical protein